MEKQVYEFIYTQMGEKIIEWRQCECGQEFPITDKDMEFYKKVSPIIGDQKYTIPSPTKCPDCRQQRRLAFRNERKLYKRTCDAVGKQIISMHSDDKPYKVYEQKEWRSDKWDPMDYGREFDFSKTFFEQFKSLHLQVPKINLILTQSNENTIYANDSAETKNCYLVVNGFKCEDSYYSSMVGYGSRYLVDCTWLVESENCYECLNCSKLYNCFYCTNSQNLSNCYHCDNCIGLQECYGCEGLVNKTNYIFNKPYSKAEYDLKVKELLENKNLSIKLGFPVKNIYSFNSENVFGDCFTHSKNCSFGFYQFFSQDTKYCYDSIIVDSYDSYISGTNLSLSYNVVMTYRSYNVMFSQSVEESKYIYYCNDCYNSSNLFGCVGLRHKEYCILNKQYTKEEYESLVPRIIEHMKKTGERGEFFPVSISPFGYNETVANDYYPLERDQAIAKGYKWQDIEYPINVPEGMDRLQAKNLPSIFELSDEQEKLILNSAVICEVSAKPFRIIKQELEFYKKFNIDLPKRHHDIRHLERLKKRAERKLYLRKCDKCEKEMITVYPQESEYKVYCEECYNKEVY